MARIHGTIESLKSLKYELENKGIHQFSSVKQIKDFLSKYNYKKQQILNEIEEKLDNEYLQNKIKLEENLKLKEEFINIENQKIDNEISKLNTKIVAYDNFSFFMKLIYLFRRFHLERKKYSLSKNKENLVKYKIIGITEEIENNKRSINKYEEDKEELIQSRAKNDLEKLEYTRSIIEKCKNLISGAIGENLVVKEISKLNDDYILINDFTLDFTHPIYYKKHNQRIYSIQIDHLLISKAGIFIIETKNWSKKSVNSLSLRSPIEQIERSNFALYIYISNNIFLKSHHWGRQDIPIRNLIVMIKNKPNVSFKYVTVKLLNELNDYIKWFEPVLTDNQVNQIAARLT
jgi:hypothetical protein